MEESPAYLKEQLITYIGNKRALLPFILGAVAEVRAEVGRDLDAADLFSGSGAVARGLRRFSRRMVVNDLEGYCETLSRCYLSCAGDRDMPTITAAFDALKAALAAELSPGFIAEMYAPRDGTHVRPGERAFYTPRNARYIDTARQAIAALPQDIQPFLLAPLLYEASVKANTAGVFKGFYKNPVTHVGQFGGGGRDALSRICADIDLPFPVFSRFDCPTEMLRMDARAACDVMPPVDLLYLDPPYNQHPYGSNYFMLNLINDYVAPAAASPVSGIPPGWNRSPFNRARDALPALLDICAAAPARYVLISMNSEGFIPRADLEAALKPLGTVTVAEQPYNAFRGSRNLRGRALHVSEYLFILKKTEFRRS
jgi:adenine-specific DNA-methyltransferase